MNIRKPRYPRSTTDPTLSGISPKKTSRDEAPKDDLEDLVLIGLASTALGAMGGSIGGATGEAHGGLLSENGGTAGVFATVGSTALLNFGASVAHQLASSDTPGYDYSAGSAALGAFSGILTSIGTAGLASGGVDPTLAGAISGGIVQGIVPLGIAAATLF